MSLKDPDRQGRLPSRCSAAGPVDVPKLAETSESFENVAAILGPEAAGHSG